jgi:hypothetical protein
VEFAADVGEVGRKLLPRAPLAEDRLRIPKKCCIPKNCCSTFFSAEEMQQAFCWGVKAFPCSPPAFLVQRGRTPDGFIEVRVKISACVLAWVSDTRAKSAAPGMSRVFS